MNLRIVLASKNKNIGWPFHLTSVETKEIVAHGNRQFYCIFKVHANVRNMNLIWSKYFKLVSDQPEFSTDAPRLGYFSMV